MNQYGFEIIRGNIVGHVNVQCYFFDRVIGFNRTLPYNKGGKTKNHEFCRPSQLNLSKWVGVQLLFN